MTSPSFDLLQRSPHDLYPPEDECHEGSPEEQIKSWVPSHYNLRTLDEKGRLILWNTYRGSIFAIPPEQVAKIEPLFRKPGFEAPSKGLVSYLAERGFIVPEDGNEQNRVRMAINRQRYQNSRLELILLASEDCNFRCKYCYEKFARGTMRPAVRTGVKNLVERNIRGLTSLSVGWFGGEPLYGMEAIEDLAPFFEQITREHSIAFHSHITTNAYLLTPDIAEMLLRWRVTSYQITVDGPPDCHNASRPARDGSPTFERIFENLRSLRRRDDAFLVALRINFDQQNVYRLAELLELFADEFGGDPRFAFIFFPVDRWGGEGDNGLEICSAQEAAAAERAAKEEAFCRGMRVETLFGRHRLGARVCYAAKPYNFIVGATGKLMKCTIVLDTKPYNVVGRLTEQGELVLDEDKLALWTRPGADDDRRCGKCVFLPICQGSACPKTRVEGGISKCVPGRHRWRDELAQVVRYESGYRSLDV